MASPPRKVAVHAWRLGRAGQDRSRKPCESYDRDSSTSWLRSPESESATRNASLVGLSDEEALKA